MVLDVHVVSNIKSIYDIDTVRQTFSVEAKYKLRWTATAKDRAKWHALQALVPQFDAKEDDNADDQETVTENGTKLLHHPSGSTVVGPRASVIAT